MLVNGDDKVDGPSSADQPTVWPGDLGTDYAGGGGAAHWSALTRGVRNNPRGTRLAGRMLIGLAAVIVLGLALAALFGLYR